MGLTSKWGLIMRWTAKAPSIVVLALSIAAPAKAQVTYTFTAISAIPYQPFPDELPFYYVSPPLGSFSYTSPTFISSSLSVTPDELNSCSSSPDPCGTQGFGTGGYDVISFDSFAAYYFAPDSFGADGTYNTVLYGTDQAGTLNVRGAPEVGSIPEPATWAMMLLGFGAIGAAVRRRKHAPRSETTCSLVATGS